MDTIEVSPRELVEVEKSREKLRDIYDQIHPKFFKLEQHITIADDVSYRDKVVNNFLLPEFLLAHGGTEEEYEEALGQLQALAAYLKLLQSYPSYCRAETTAATGAFPELFSSWEQAQKTRQSAGLPEQSPSIYYIEESKKRLAAIGTAAKKSE